jgi:hypothetical protein
VRPKGTPDPRAEDAPIRVDNEQMDRARSRTTLAELLENPAHARYARIPVPLLDPELPEIPADRMEYLRQKRDEILARLRREWGSDGRE